MMTTEKSSTMYSIIRTTTIHSSFILIEKYCLIIPPDFPRWFIEWFSNLGSVKSILAKAVLEGYELFRTIINY